MRDHLRSFAFVLATSLLAWAALGVHASPVCALTDDAGAPPESVAQVKVALAQLAPAFDPARRAVRSGAPGSIEAAIAGHVPTKFHSVAEGTLAAPKSGARCPSDMAVSGGGRFCIDKYECEVMEQMPNGSLQSHPIYEPLISTHIYIAKSVAGVVPQAYVSGAEALAACTNAGKRLCEPVEWRAACGGSQGYAFPYGPDRAAKKCHDTGTAPMLVFYASSLSRGFNGNELNDPRLDRLEGTIGKTGAFPECVTDEGVYDMVGNLDEWTADANGTFQGGYWLDTSQHGDGCAYRTIAHEFGYHDYSLGFRCCADPQ